MQRSPCLRRPQERSLFAGGVGGERRRARGAASRSAASAPSASSASSTTRLDPVSGRNLDGPDLSCSCPSGLMLPNPFVIGSGPPGTNRAVMRRAFLEGWGAVVAKTVSLDASKVVNVTPRYSKIRSRVGGELIGWENIELISDRPFETMLDDFKRLKDEFPDRVLIASIMEEYSEERWLELVERVEVEGGVDAIEINFSCPHGMPERKMGQAMGQDCALLEEVSGWVSSKTKLPFWAKLTPNVTSVADAGRAALRGGARGLAAINTINSISGVDLDTLRPQPCVEGATTPGGYSGPAVKPVALAKVAALAGMIASEEMGGRFDLSGIGGVETGFDAAEFLLLGADNVQVCTGVMVHGYGLASELASGLSQFMIKKEFATIADFKGLALPHVTSHSELVSLQRAAVAARKERAAKEGASSDSRVSAPKRDDEWSGEGDDFVRQSDAMVAE